MKRLFVIIAVCLCALMKVAAYNSTYNVNVGDQFTVYTTYHNYTYAVLWTYDWSVVEPVSYIGSASTSVTFRAIAPSPSAGSVIQATSYYYRNGTTSSGTNKDVDDWKVYVTDPGPTGVSIIPGIVIENPRIIWRFGDFFVTLPPTIRNPQFANSK